MDGSGGRQYAAEQCEVIDPEKAERYRCMAVHKGPRPGRKRRAHPRQGDMRSKTARVRLKPRRVSQGRIDTSFEIKEFRAWLQSGPENILALMREQSQPPDAQRKRGCPYSAERVFHRCGKIRWNVSDKAHGQMRIRGLRPADSGQSSPQGRQPGARLFR